MRALPLALVGTALSLWTAPLMGADLILSGESIALSGDHTFGLVSLGGGAAIEVPPAEGGEGGRLSITCDILNVDSASVIRASGAGYAGVSLGAGAGPGGGGGGSTGGGGGHGGLGGAGGPSGGLAGGAPGAVYGGDVARLGSAGGGGGDGLPGGAGGGHVEIRAGVIVVGGQLMAEGAPGAGLAGGGAGGTISLTGASVTLRGVLSVAGGAGGSVPGVGGGGGGGGGRIVIALEEGDFDLATLNRRGGRGSLGAEDGRDGAIAVGFTDFDGDGYNALEGDCDPLDPAIGPGAVEILDGSDDDCDGRIDEGTDAFDDDGDGVTENSGDCDDEDPATGPGVPELPDGRDNDCDGEIDEGADATPSPSPGASPSPSAGEESPSPSPDLTPTAEETYPIDTGVLIDIEDDAGCACSGGGRGERGGWGMLALGLLLALGLRRKSL